MNKTFYFNCIYKTKVLKSYYERVIYMNKTMYKDRDNKMLAGVCTGISEYFNMDVSLVRIIFVLLGLFTGVGVILYIILAIILPEKEDVLYREKEDVTYNEKK